MNLSGYSFRPIEYSSFVTMVARRRVIETPLYAMLDGDEWLKVNASHR